MIAVMLSVELPQLSPMTVCLQRAVEAPTPRGPLITLYVILTGEPDQGTARRVSFPTMEAPDVQRL